MPHEVLVYNFIAFIQWAPGRTFDTGYGIDLFAECLQEDHFGSTCSARFTVDTGKQKSWWVRRSQRSVLSSRDLLRLFHRMMAGIALKWIGREGKTDVHLPEEYLAFFIHLSQCLPCFVDVEDLEIKTHLEWEMFYLSTLSLLTT